MGKDGSESSKEGLAMSEDAPVNTGARGWPSDARAFLMVRGMQTKLHRWAAGEPGRRFDDLYNLVCDPAFLVMAWERVAQNKGSRTPGVDRATVAHITSGVGVEVFLQGVRDQLRARTFQPVAVRQVMIPKASGKLRKLGIPTVTDRVVQAALKLVLEPIFEADFRPCSYGFRPNRRAQDAVAEIQHFTTRSYEWVLEADIEACFDMIDHVALLDRVRRRIADKRVLALVKAFLKAGVMTTTGGQEETLTGTPQGGILSPLLANIALTTLDDYFARRWTQEMATDHRRTRRRRLGEANYRLIRYADDFVVVVSGERHHAEYLRQEVAAVLAPMGLRLSPDKTHVVHIDDGFDFLGRLCLIRRRTVIEVGGFRDGFDGAEEWDLHLRVTERTQAIEHLPVIGVSHPAPRRTDPGAAGKDIQVFELIAGGYESLWRLLLAHAHDHHAGLPKPGGQAGKIAVAGDQTEAFHIAGVQDVHSVDDHGGVRGVFPGRVAILLDRGDRMLEKHLFPGRQRRLGPIAVDPFVSGFAVVGNFVEYDFYIFI